MLVGPTTAPTAQGAAPSRTEPVVAAVPAVPAPASSTQPQTLRALVPVTAAAPRSPLEDVRTRLAIQQLQARDREVRQHEHAQMSAARGLVRSGPTYNYSIDPDGKRYVVGGGVEIETAEDRDDPEANAEKGRRIQADALAPAEPSGADLSVAVISARMEQRALAEIARRELAANTYAEEAEGRGAMPRGVLVIREA